jgi:SPP1 family predicted phage head-tail adaptor
MPLGSMRERITIQHKTVTADEIGQKVENWQDFLICRAYANGLSGSEYFEAMRVNAENTVVFTIRYNRRLQNIDPINYRILWNRKTYNLDNCDNVMYRNMYLKLRGRCDNGD